MNRLPVSFAILMIVAGCAAPEQQRPPFQATTRRSADALFAEYEANEVQADNAYKGKWLKVDGTVDDIGKDIVDTPYVTLHVNASGLGGVQAMFTRNKDESMIGGFHKGQYVEFVCRADGKLFNVLLRNCGQP